MRAALAPPIAASCLGLSFQDCESMKEYTHIVSTTTVSNYAVYIGKVLGKGSFLFQQKCQPAPHLPASQRPFLACG